MSSSIAAEYGQLKKSGLFDPEYYLAAYPDVARAGVDPLLHYVLHGASEGRRPRRDFDVTFYIEQCSGLGLPVEGNPLLHYVVHGYKFGVEFDPSVFPAGENTQKSWADQSHNGDVGTPTAGDVDNADYVATVVSKKFDPGFYLAEYGDVQEIGADPLTHFLNEGWREGRNPRADFDTQFYLTSNPDVAAAGINPFFHFLVAGKAEGRPPAKPSSATDPATSDQSLDPFVRESVARQLDREYYLSCYPDVAAAGVDPVDHYLSTGWLEGRNPCWEFDTNFYLDCYPDVREARVNPFFHYIVAGREEGRKARDELAIEVEILKSALPPRERAISWLRRDTPKLLDASELARALKRLSVRRPIGVCIAVSHDNYLQVVGGIQNCLADEQKALNVGGLDYVQISPTQPLPLLADAQNMGTAAITITMNGVFVGHSRLSRLSSALDSNGWSGSQKSRMRPTLIIHSLLGHSPEALSRFRKRIGAGEGLFWLHDYNSLCQSFTLLRNDLSFCGGPPLESTSCSVCVYGVERTSHMARMRALFRELKPTVVSPSAAALRVWRSANPDLDHSAAVVVPHCVVAQRRSQKTRTRERGRPIRIGFLGYDKYHKGWATFSRIAERFRSDQRYEFVHLGHRTTPVPHIRHVPVKVTQQDRDAMVQAIKKCEIDVVIVWPAWPETFSFVVFEALAGGALVITHNNSGNVAAATREHNAGWVLADENQIYNLLSSTSFGNRCRRNTRDAPWRGRLRYSGCSAELLLKDAAR